MTGRKVEVVASLAVYDGRTHLGDVAELRNGQFRATDSDGGKVGGLFDKFEDARSAIIQARLSLTGAAS